MRTRERYVKPAPLGRQSTALLQSEAVVLQQTPVVYIFGAMGSRLFVGNLPWAAAENDLRNLFGEGNVAQVKILLDRETGRSRGFGFVEMVSAEAADEAIRAFDGQDFMGRELRVNAAHERERKMGGGDGRSYGGDQGRDPGTGSDRGRERGSRRHGDDDDW